MIMESGYHVLSLNILANNVTLFAFFVMSQSKGWKAKFCNEIICPCFFFFNTNY